MDEISLHWYFHNWIEDQEEEVNKMKQFGCFVGSFYNHEMAKKIMDKDNNDTVSVSDDDMQKAMEYVKADKPIINKKKKGKIRMNQ